MKLSVIGFLLPLMSLLSGCASSGPNTQPKIIEPLKVPTTIKAQKESFLQELEFELGKDLKETLSFKNIAPSPDPFLRVYKGLMNEKLF